jgi:hypothetical protein
MFKFLPFLVLLAACSGSTQTDKEKETPNKERHVKVSTEETNYCHPSALEPGDTLKEKLPNVKANEYGEVYDLDRTLPPITREKLLEQLKDCHPKEEISFSKKQIIIRFMKGQRVAEKSYYLTDETCEYRSRFLPYK